MSSITTTFDPLQVEIIIQRVIAGGLPEIALTAGKNAAREIVTPYPMFPVYPLRWRSPQQRAAVMAKLAAEDNLPYQRTGRLENSWEAKRISGGMVIENVAQGSDGEYYADSVVGFAQEPFHADTGWVKGPDKEPEIMERVCDAIADDIRREIIRELFR